MKTSEIGGREYFVVELEDVLNAKVLGDNHVVEDWPWGRKQRCSMHFSVERSKKGERFVKQSTIRDLPEFGGPTKTTCPAPSRSI